MTEPQDSLQLYEAGTEGRVSQYHKISDDNATLKINVAYIPGEQSITPASISDYLEQLYDDLPEQHESKEAVAEHLVGTAFNDLRETIDGPEYLGIRLESSTSRKKYADSDLYHLDTITRVTETEHNFLEEEDFL
ncbi:MAG: hypothetical protein SVU32_09130 [Candidatus Nanohaloarchaea archaeon]|nr:hypothetical protein [Candidatus Nanohaloarchaea archaeon]